MEPRQQQNEQPAANKTLARDLGRQLTELDRTVTDVRARIAEVQTTLSTLRFHAGALGSDEVARAPERRRSMLAPGMENETRSKADSEAAARQRGAERQAGPDERLSRGDGAPALAALHAEVLAARERLIARDPGLENQIRQAYGHAIVPALGRASLLVGGARGFGEVFERGRSIGFIRLTQVTFGVQVGGQTLTELVLFASKESLEQFKRSPLVFNGNFSAVFIRGAAFTNNFRDATAYAYSRGGMLLEASLGGQKFRFLDEAAAANLTRRAAGARRRRKRDGAYERAAGAPS